jgi:hypothetical protein
MVPAPMCATPQRFPGAGVGGLSAGRCRLTRGRRGREELTGGGGRSPEARETVSCASEGIGLDSCCVLRLCEACHYFFFRIRATALGKMQPRTGPAREWTSTPLGPCLHGLIPRTLARVSTLGSPAARRRRRRRPVRHRHSRRASTVRFSTLPSPSFNLRSEEGHISTQKSCLYHGE